MPSSFCLLMETFHWNIFFNYICPTLTQSTSNYDYFNINIQYILYLSFSFERRIFVWQVCNLAWKTHNKYTIITFNCRITKCFSLLCLLNQFKHKILIQKWRRRQRANICPGSSCPPASTLRWGSRTPVFHQSRRRDRKNRLNIFYQINIRTVISYLSSGLCCRCWPHGDYGVEMAAL